MSLPRLLITGATGFIGAHVVHQALEAGYPVRITSRPSKVELMENKYGSKVDIAAVADIGTGDLTDALKGIDIVVHVAAGLPMNQDADSMINSGINGILNVLKYVALAKIPKVVVTSSFVTAEKFDDTSILFRERLYTEKDWNTSTKEELEASKTNPFLAYTIVKTFAERELWAFAEKHPEIDITTINPPFVYGPFAPGTTIAKGDIGGLSTNGIFFQNLLSNAKLERLQANSPPPTVDVRDVAKAHILALTAPPTSQVGRKRILIGGPKFLWKDAVQLLHGTRPAYRDRLSDASEAIDHVTITIDNSRAKEVLGLTEFTDWKDTVQDTADALVEVMKTWA